MHTLSLLDAIVAGFADRHGESQVNADQRSALHDLASDKRNVWEYVSDDATKLERGTCFASK